jgi:phospholipid/cholesterol/gamma-HCH transport system substrate-binding protein
VTTTQDAPEGSAGDARRGRLLETAVGAFVVGALVLAAAIILVLGSHSHLFERRLTMHADFSDVQGLKEGAAVRLGGVDVGTVSRVSLPVDRAHPTVRVDLEITGAAFARLGRDASAHIGGQGLLGDKIVEMTMGTPGAEPLRPGDAVRTVPPADVDRMLEQAALIVGKAERVAESAARVMEAFADPKTIENIQGSVSSMRHLLRAAEQGPGLAHALFYDRRQADALSKLLDDADRVVADVDSGVRKVDAVLGTTDGEGRQVLNNISHAARSLDETAALLRDSKIVPNLDRASADLAALTAHVRSGQGTLGAVIADPTVYEQLVIVLGGVARSRVLRALVRYAISRDDDKAVSNRVLDSENGRTVKPPGSMKATR